MDTRDWHIQWGVPPKYDVSTLAVILATTHCWLWSARMTLRAEALKNAGLMFADSTQSPPHPTLTCRPLPQGARLKKMKGGDKSTIFSTNLLVYELHVLLLFVLHLVVDF